MASKCNFRASVTAVGVILLLLLLRYPPTNAHVSLQSYSQFYWVFFFGFLHLFVPPVMVGFVCHGPVLFIS